jgi:hypothetical protein
VNAKPGFLQQVIGIRTALQLRKEKSMEPRADALDKIRDRVEIALLIASHQRLEIAVRVHGFECLPEINISTSVFAQFGPRRQAPSQTHFDSVLSYSMEGA